MINYDYKVRKDSIEEIQDEFRNYRFEKEGWYICATDTALLMKDNSSIIVYVWNSWDPRETIKTILNLPEHK